ncbi:hypothetical protein NAI43_12040, partial [Francisella tularensis subsp. holarctica]
KATPLKAPKAVRGTRKDDNINITETTLAASSKDLNLALISLKSSYPSFLSEFLFSIEQFLLLYRNLYKLFSLQKNS